MMQKYLELDHLLLKANLLQNLSLPVSESGLDFLLFVRIFRYKKTYTALFLYCPLSGKAFCPLITPLNRFTSSHRSAHDGFFLGKYHFLPPGGLLEFGGGNT